jgi:hypothetical protein
MVFDYSELRGKIKAKYGNQEAFAYAMDFNASTLSQKLNNRADWSRIEIYKACKLLNIPLQDVPLYFFKC